MKKALIFLLIATLMLVGCTNNVSNESDVVSNSSKKEETIDLLDKGLTEEEKEAEEERKEMFANSTPTNDTDLGLKNVKIDTAEANLTKEQKAVIAYFDSDYFSAPYVEFLRRYPSVFNGAQMQFYISQVQKILSVEDNKYSIVVVEGQAGLYAPLEQIGMIVKGNCEDSLFLEGDIIKIKGRYQGVETITIDGVTATLPVINAYDASFSDDHQFDLSDIKMISRSIFGEDVEIRNLKKDEEIDASVLETYEDFGLQYYVCELENQSNAKFSKFLFDADGGKIEVLNNFISFDSLYSNPELERHVEFSADFKHFFVFSYDHSLETMTLEYYDHDLNKLWKREFEEVSPTEASGDMTRIYDFTKNNVYCLVNNELYIINTGTGENTFAPKYVGKKIGVTKLEDGIILISEDKSDGIMKLGLDGNMIWKTNTAGNMFNLEAIQIVNGNIVVNVSMRDAKDEKNNGQHFVVLNLEDGSVVTDAVGEY